MVEQSSVDLGIIGLTDATRIAQGGFAIVYRARQDRFDRLVAVKVLTGAVDASLQAAFDRECRAIGKLSGHPNILMVYASGTTGGDGRPYLIMEYLPGGSLEDRLTKGPIAWRSVVDIGIKLATALHSAHSHDILHRDVKPDNVLMAEKDEPKLADFGIARLVDAVRMTRGDVAFTPFYAAPEVIEGKPHTRAADVYSLGATIYALIGGAPAFFNRSDESLVPFFQRVVQDPVPDLRPAGVPEELCRLIEQAMAKQTRDRPSALTLAERLKAISEEQGRAMPHAATIPDHSDPPVRDRRRWQSPWVRAGVAVATAVALVGVFLATRSGGSASPRALSPATTLSRTTLGGSTTTGVLPPFPPDPDAASPDITALLRFRAPGQGTTNSMTTDGDVLWLLGDAGTMFEITTSGKLLDAIGPPAGTPGAIAWDGSSFFVDTSSHLLIYHFDVVDDEPNVLGTFPAPVTALAFDGSALLVGHGDGTIDRMDRSGTVLHTYTTSVRSLSAFTWLKGSLWAAADAVSTTFPPPFASDIYQIPMP